MKSLLKIKEKLKKFVGKNEVFILPVLKFLLTFAALSKINSSIGFMPRLSNGAITLIVALAGSFLPLNLTLVILSIIIIGHVYALSLECAIVVLALFLIMFLLYFRFASKDAVGAILVPLSFVYKVPFVMPVSMGLVGSPASMVSSACGVVVYYVLHYISINAKTFTAVGGEEFDAAKLSAFRDLVDSVVNNKEMMVMAVAFAATVLVVYIIRRLSIPYSWSIAIGTGSILCFVIVLIGNSAAHAGISAGAAFGGMIISIILNTILQYFCFDLDYNRTEKVQFEDDEYYYYVKAVPKNTIRLSDNGKKKKKPAERKPEGAKAVARPAARRPEAARTAVERESVTRAGSERTSTEVKARQAVRTTAANAAKARSASKGPLGMSGGRPAGEGRRIDNNGKAD